MHPLRLYLDQAARTPFAWGRCDCLLFAADWLVSQGGADPAAGVRGRYRTRLGAQRILRRAGGLLPLSDRAMTEAGYAAAETPVAGDVGVLEVETPDGPGQAGGVFDGRLWACLGPGGLLLGPARPLRVWRMACPRP